MREYVFLECAECGDRNYRTQINWGLNYIQERYQSPCGALNFHLSNNWY